MTIEAGTRLGPDEVLIYREAPNIVVNKVPPGMNRAALKQKVEQAYAAPVLAMMPLNSEIVTVASGGIFITRHPDHPFTQELRAVVRAMLE